MPKRNRKGTGTLVKPKGHRYWYIRFKRKGRKDRIISTKATNEAEAERVRRRYVAEMERGTSLDAYSVTLADLAALVVQDYRINGYKTLRDLVNRLDKHTLPFFGTMTKAMEVKTYEIERFKAYRIKEGASPAEVNRELSDLRRGYTIARNNDVLSYSPRFNLFREARKRTTYWKDEEIVKLFEAWRNKWTLPVVQFMNWTGWRVSEVQGLTWENIDWQQEHVILKEGTTKSGEARIFPFHFIPELKLLLHNQWNVSKQFQCVKVQYVFFREHGGPIHNFEKDWKAATKASAFTGKKRHDFRSTAARRLILQYHIPAQIVIKMVGWADLDMLQYYMVTETQDVHDAVAQISKATLRKVKGGKR